MDLMIASSYTVQLKENILRFVYLYVMLYLFLQIDPRLSVFLYKEKLSNPEPMSSTDVFVQVHERSNTYLFMIQLCFRLSLFKTIILLL